MNLEDLVDAHLAGQNPHVPKELRSEFDRAIKGHAALQDALADVETIGPSSESMYRPPPELPEDYEIVRELGRGGMGVVYLVRQKSLGRQVAVKVLRPGEATFGPVVQRFLEEARHLARLRHANIVSIHEIGKAGDEPYFTMDYVEGEPLSALLARERLPPSRALALWKQAALGVEHAHAQGIIHRDLKPGNILIDQQGRAYVTDFGLSRDLTRNSELTKPGEVMGTPAYMAPEQAQGQSNLIGEATDVHALGAILFEMLTGQPPYGKDAPLDILVRLMREEPVSPRRLDRRIPRDLETICLKALAKAPERRYATVHALLEDIRRFEAGRPILARRPSFAGRGLRFLRQHWKPTAAMALTALLVGLLCYFLFSPRADELMAEGDERHTAGKHAEAAQLYRRAARWAGPYQRSIVLERLIRCNREIGDTRGGVDACLQMLDYDPDAAFGEYDHDVAQAVLAERRTIRTNTFFGITRDIGPEELALKRLQIFLNGPYGTEAERKGAETALAELRASLPQVPTGFKGIPERDLTLPSEKPAELLRQANNKGASLFDRFPPALAAARELEKAGDKAGAVAAYRLAYELLRARFPAYAGVTGFGLGMSNPGVTGIALEMSRPRSFRWEPMECAALRHIVHELGRLDPEMRNPLRGGLRFRIAGLDLPPDLVIILGVTLWDPESPGPGRGMQQVNGETIPAPLGGVPVQLDQTAWIGVADGHYRLNVSCSTKGGRSSDSYGARANMLFKDLELDFSELEKEVVIQGKTVELRPIRARLRD